MFTMGPPLWAAADPLDPFVKLLMRFNNNVTDEKGHAFTSGGAVTYVSDWLSGTAISINGAPTPGGTNGVFLTTASSDYDLQGDFCIEAACKIFSLADTKRIISLYEGSNPTYDIGFSNSGNEANAVAVTGPASSVTMHGPAISLNTPYHLALCRQGSTIKLYVNGTSAATLGTSYYWTSNPVKVTIGNHYQGFSHALDGEIAWARITNGHCRYTGNFTVPGEP